MSRGRAWAAGVVAFVVAQVLAVLIHGLILSADYQPYEGTLLRSGTGTEAPWQMLFLPVVHLSVVASMVWLYGRLRIGGSRLARGVQLGLVGFTMSQLPLWLLWYAQQPWPGDLVVKQLGLALLSSTAIGVAIALVAGSSAPAAHGAAVSAGS